MRIMPFMKRKKGIQFAGIGIDSGGGDTSALANKTDLTAIILTGTANTSGDVISAGTWFYLNGTPCVAKVDIAPGATFTEGTNYEDKTIGGVLSELNSNKISTICSTKSDANDVSGNKIEIFSVSTDIAHSPGAGYWTILSIPYSKERIRQIAIGGYDKDGPIVEVRLSEYNSSNPGEPDWGPWHQVTVQ